MTTENQPWFGKRWTKGAVNWLDSAIFGQKIKEGGYSLASCVCHNFTLGLIGGFIHAILLIFNEQDIANFVSNVALVCISLLTSVYVLWGTLRYFDTIWSKIGRSLYVIVLNSIGCFIGEFIGLSLTLITFVLLVIWLTLKLWLWYTAKSKEKTVILDDGTVLDVETGICGEKYYTDRAGQSYNKVGSDTFRKDETPGA